MKRFFAVLAIGATATAATVLTAMPSYAAVSCTGPMTNMTIVGTVNVPAGGHCQLENVNVQGSITVQPGGGLQLALSEVHGNVTATNPTGFRMAVGQSNVAGVDTVYGNVTVSGTSAASMGNNAICRSRITGNLSVTGTTAPFFAMGGANTPPAQPNQCNPISGFPHGESLIGGDVTIARNAAHMDFHWNQIAGNLTVNGNTGTGSLTDNTVGGNLTCTANSSGYVTSPNSVAKNNTC